MPAENISAASVDYGLCRDRAFHNGARLMPGKNIRKAFEESLEQQYVQKQIQSDKIPEIFMKLLSQESFEVMEHFGMDTPRLLNQYCCAVEDALVEQMKKAIDYKEKCIALSDEVKRLKDLIAIEDSLTE